MCRTTASTIGVRDKVASQSVCCRSRFATGGLEYNGENALLDGSFNHDDHFFEVGKISGDIYLHTSTGVFTDDGSTAVSSKVRLRVKPNQLYFEPKCEWQCQVRWRVPL